MRLGFNQSQWLKPYIEFNTQKRIEAERINDGKALYKLMHNVIYGKRMENVGSRIDAKLVNNEKGNLKYTSQVSYISDTIFDNDLVVMQNSKLALKVKNLHTLECVFWNEVKYYCTNSIMITLKINMTLEQNNFS